MFLMEIGKKQFADEFVRHLKSYKSPLMDPAVFVGKKLSGLSEVYWF